MKSELVRVQAIGDFSNTTWRHERSKLHLFSGETYGFFGTSKSGKNELSAMLAGLEKFQNTEIYLEGQRVRSAEAMRENAHTIAPINYSITNWSVAEYVLLPRLKYRSPFLNMNTIVRDAQNLIDGLGFPIDARDNMGRIPEYTKRIADLVTAYTKNAKVLVIHDSFEGIRLEDIKEFLLMIKAMLQRGAVAIINTPSEAINQMLADQYIFFRKGNVVRKIAANKVAAEARQKQALFGPGLRDDGRSDVTGPPNHTDAPTTFAVQGMHFGDGRVVSFELQSGQIAVVVAPDQREKLALFAFLSGREVQKGAVFRINGRVAKLRSIADFVRRKVVSSENIGTDHELFSRMTVAENILMPSLSKISGFWYLLTGKRIQKSVGHHRIEMTLHGRDYAALETEHSISIVFARWMVFRPRVLVLLDPFVQCGAAGESLVASYLHHLSRGGTIVIIIQSRDRTIGIAGSTTYYLD